jgi:release factor glutamine methyltransferase
MNNKNYHFILGDLCKQESLRLKKGGIESYIMEAEVILADILNISREYLLSHPEQRIDRYDYIEYKKRIDQRKGGTPLAYLLGYKEFYGLKFQVNKNVLIPRPETELLIDETLRYLDSKNALESIVMADIGTGSGCIPISLLKNANKKNIKFFCSDISRQALKTAYLNANTHKVEKCIKFLYGNLAIPIFSELKHIKKSQEFIVTANLPYLSEKKYSNSFSIQKEPKRALVAGEPNGLEMYKILLHQLCRLKERIDKKIIVFCELDNDQIDLFKRIVADSFSFYKVTFKKDYKDNYRLAILELGI